MLSHTLHHISLCHIHTFMFYFGWRTTYGTVDGPGRPSVTAILGLEGSLATKIAIDSPGDRFVPSVA